MAFQVDAIAMGRDNGLEEYRRTEEQCPVCDDGRLYTRQSEKVCGECFTVIEPENPISWESQWNLFWQEREDYAGWHGPKRVKMVGGFAGAYSQE